MRNLLLILATAFFSNVYGQESTDILTYAKTEIIAPDGCSAKSKYEKSLTAMGFLLNGSI